MNLTRNDIGLFFSRELNYSKTFIYLRILHFTIRHNLPYHSIMEEIGRLSRISAQELAGSTLIHRNEALQQIQHEIQSNLSNIIQANKQDLEVAKQNNLDGAIVKVCIVK